MAETCPICESTRRTVRHLFRLVEGTTKTEIRRPCWSRWHDGEGDIGIFDGPPTPGSGADNADIEPRKP